MSKAPAGASDSPGKRRRHLVVVSVLLAAFLSYLVLREMDLDETRRVFGEWHWAYAPVLVLLALSKNLVRGLRLSAMDRGGAGAGSYFFAVSFQNLFFLTLPAVLSEASLVYVLRKVLKVDLHQSIMNVTIVRSFDLVVYVLFSVAVLAVAWRSVPTLLLWGLAFLLLGLVIVLGLMRWIMAFEGTETNRPHGVAGFVAGQVEMFKVALESIAQRRLLVAVAAYTVANYMVSLAMFVVVVRAFHRELQWLDSVLLNVFTTPIFLLPVKGLGNFGTHEAAYFYGLQLLGVARETAVGVALGTHAVDLVVGLSMTAVGLAGLLALGRRKAH